MNKKEDKGKNIFMIRLSFLQRFFLYGIIGLLLEIVWTGLNSLFNMDFTLTGHTSIIMLPIYGMTVFLEPLFLRLKNIPVVYRGCIYSAIILSCEFITGYILKGIGICPWDYTGQGLNVCGIIRLDYAPIWFAAGLIFEKISDRVSGISLHHTT